MRSFEGISFWWALTLLGVIALIFGFRSWWGMQSVKSDARADYEYKLKNNMIPAGLDQTSYEQLYRRVHGPRAQFHIFIGVVAILLMTPIAMLVLEQGLNLIYNLSGQNRVIEPGFLVWQFFIFFGVLGTWVGVGYAVARHFHRTAPGSLQYEIDQHLYGGDNYGERF